STAGRRFGGTGLGLALVKTFAEMHGGAVTVESVLGQGSEFRVLLPVRSAQIRGDAGLVPQPVLVVEDDRAVFEHLSPLLEEAGFAPVLAKSGDAALALARSLAAAGVNPRPRPPRPRRRLGGAEEPQGRAGDGRHPHRHLLAPGEPRAGAGA